MSIELKGLDSLQKKLESLTNLELSEAIQSVEQDAINEIRKSASFAPKASQYIGKSAVRQEYGRYYYVDIGIRNDNVDFYKWCELYYHNYGYQDKGLNFGEYWGPYIDMHAQWFYGAVNTLSKKYKSTISKKIREGYKRKTKKKVR